MDLVPRAESAFHVAKIPSTDILLLVSALTLLALCYYWKKLNGTRPNESTVLWKNQWVYHFIVHDDFPNQTHSYTWEVWCVEDMCLHVACFATVQPPDEVIPTPRRTSPHGKYMNMYMICKDHANVHLCVCFPQANRKLARLSHKLFRN